MLLRPVVVRMGGGTRLCSYPRRVHGRVSEEREGGRVAIAGALSLLAYLVLHAAAATTVEMPG